MNKAVITAILVILLSTIALGMPEYACEQKETGNNIVITCKASEEINNIVNEVSSLDDAELLNKELSQMDQTFVKKFQSSGKKSQVHAYLDDVRTGVSIKLSEHDIKKIVEEDISYSEFVNKYVRG
ncbi:hypothetical protein KY346_04650 [Candidatus Woesearchaeota archaeon]|nr:hypothetical protein [Candidatus Woesearchaeota archaeon]